MSSFSILVRIDGVETDVVDRIALPHHAFSILVRIDGVETRCKPAEGKRMGATFSILVRIDGVETAGSTNITVATPSFQYPRSDRWG